jgi:hypothetical protein
VDAVEDRTREVNTHPSWESPAEIIEGAAVGHTDTDDTTCLHVPSIGLVVAGDAVYNGIHPFLNESNRQTRLEWIAALDKIDALKPSAVRATVHMSFTGHFTGTVAFHLRPS